MVKYLIPLGSITGDPPGTKRFMECDSDNPSTAAAQTIIFNPNLKQENRITSIRR
jgi:hypothetical protein